MFPQLTADQQIRVAEEIHNFTSRTPHKRPESEEPLVAAAEKVA
jgi:hypothetical protein